jgi:HEAT repeat protein
MSQITSIRSTDAMRRILLLAYCLLLAAGAYSQIDESRPGRGIYDANKANVSNAIARVKSGHFAGVDVDMIRRGKAVEAIPALKEQFARVKEPLDKAQIASVLLKLGDKDETYWDFLVKLSTQVTDAPDFWSYDSQGELVPGPTAEFIAWAKASNLSAAEMGEWPQYWLPGPIAALGMSGDPRAVPLLQQSLLSRNHMIEMAAAKGLAEFQDKDSIPLIIEACKKAPAGAADVIAEALVYFDDLDAQRAVDTYIAKDRARMLREARAQGKRTPWSY